MLGKLLKYELKATSRIFLLLYPAIILFAIINKVTSMVLENVRSEFAMIPQSLLGFIYCALIITVCVVTFIMIIQRFYKNLIGQEGYLMFTLPVTSTSLILSKLITAIIWTVSSVAVITASVFILGYYDGMFAQMTHGNRMFLQALNEYGISPSAPIILVVVLLFVSMLFIIMSIYTAMSIGQLGTKNKLLFSAIAYFVISTVNQVVGTIITLITMTSFNGEKLEHYIWQIEESNSVENLKEVSQVMATEMYKLISTVGIVFIIYLAIATIGMFIASKYLLSKKLNLE